MLPPGKLKSPSATTEKILKTSRIYLKNLRKEHAPLYVKRDITINLITIIHTASSNLH